MKKTLVILLSVIFAIIALGCSGNNMTTDSWSNVAYANNEYVQMELVERNGMCLTYRDKLTDVMYLVVGGYSTAMMTVILNSDGTPKLYSEQTN